MNARIYSYLQKLAAQSGIQNRKVVRVLIAKAATWHHKNPEFTRWVESVLVKMAENQPNPFPRPPRGALQGPIQIGSNRWGGPVGLNMDETAHSLWVGRTQVGKSTGLARTLIEVDKNFDIPIIAVDPKKSLRGAVPSVENLHPIRLDEIKFNPFSVPFESEKRQKQWISGCWEIIARESDLLSGSLSYGFRILADLLNESESTDESPTMFDFYEKIRELSVTTPKSSPKYRYNERISSRIERLLYTFDYTFDCLQGFPVEEFLNPDTHIILETDGIEPDVARTVVLLLLHSIYHYNLIHGYRGSGIKLMVLIDEAENFIGFESKYDRSKKGVSFISQLLERGKEMGFSITMSVHHTKLTSAAFENLTTRVCMDLSSSDDVKKISSDMGLTKEQEEVLEQLGVGEAVMKVKGKWEEPFTIKIDPVPLPGVSDRQVKEHNKEFMKELNNKVVARKKKTSKKTSKHQKQSKIDKNSHVLLENLARFPYLSITERKDKLGWSNSRLSNTRKKLRSKGYIRKKRLKKPEGGRGSTLTILEATGKALKYLKDKGIKNKYLGRGGAVHSYYMQWFLDKLKQKNVDVSYETDLGGISVDLFIVKQSGKTQAIEIEVSSSKNTLGKLEKLLEMTDRVLIVSDKKVLVNEFKEKIKEMNIDQDRVSVRKIQEIEF